MKEWANKNLSSLISVLGAVLFAAIVILTIYAVGLGTSINGEIIKYNNLHDSTNIISSSADKLVTAALIISIIAIVPVTVRLVLGIIGIDLFARLFNATTIALAVVGVILLISANIELINLAGSKVHVGSIIGFYILLLVGVSIVSAPIIKK